MIPALNKLARGEPVSSLETEALKTWGDTIERNNNFIEGMQAGKIDINTNVLRAFSSEFRYQPVLLASSIGFTASVPSSDLYTSTTLSSCEYDNLKGYTNGSTAFRIPFKGKYSFSIFSQWEANPNDIRRIQVFVYGRGHIGGHQYAHCSESYPATVFFYEEASVPSGALINILVAQESGSTLACEGSATISLVRTHDADGYG